MKTKLTPDEKLEVFYNAKHARRLAAEDRFLAKREKQEAAAEAKIGELVRDGRTVYYAVLSTKRWRVRESTTRQELVEFLIRHYYV